MVEVVVRREELFARLQAAQQSGDARIAAVRAGCAVGLVNAVEPAGDILRRIAEEAERILRERPRAVLR